MTAEEKKMKELAVSAARAYSLGLNPMPAMRWLADTGDCPRIHYFAGHLPAAAVAGDFALRRHESNGRICVEISRLEAAGDELIGGDIVASSDWIDKLAQ